MNESNRNIVKLRRRTFLSALGISGVISVSGCERQPAERALPLLQGSADVEPGRSVRYASTCLACPAACGLLVTARDGRPIKLEGLEDHPLSRGGLCALAQASVRGLYDAGRLRKPRVDGADADWEEVDRRVAAGLAKARGKLAVLTPPLVSASARRAIERLLAKYGGELVEYEPGLTSASGVVEAYRLLDGRPSDPAVDIGAADLWLSIGGDPVGTGAGAVVLARQLAERRRARLHKGDFRHMHLEGNLSLTGAGADVRVRATAAERSLFAAQLLARVAGRVPGPSSERALRLTAGLPPLPGHEQKLALLAAELVTRRGKVLVTSAARQPAEQLAVALLNRVLDAEGRTLDLGAPMQTRHGRDAALAGLLAGLEAGRVAGLIMIGVNPVEQLPGGDALAETLQRLALSVAVTSRPTATADACQVVAAAHHELERWSDAEPRPGVFTVAQPTIRPLFDTRDPIQSVLRWAGERQTVRDDIKAHFMQRAAAGERAWDEALSRGMAGGVAAVATGDGGSALADEAAVAAHLKGLVAPADTLEVELLEEVGPRDGRNSFNPWLRELPDPLTRSAWVATARIAPVLAAERGIADGDVVSVAVGERVVQMQARISPGQHPQVVGIPVGYGVKDGDGGEAVRNGYRLASFAGGELKISGLPATLERVGGGSALPLMQWESSTHGRPIIFQVGGDDEKVEVPHQPDHALWGDDWHYEPHWHMVIDLDRCTGCSACVVACQAENNLPVVGPDNMVDHRDMYWLRIDRYFTGEDDPNGPEVLFEPMLCAQCDNAPCETVCPVAATVHSHDGLNMQAYNRCVGTRYCANNCPYKVRRFNWFDFTPSDPLERLVLNPDVVVRERGVMEKCTFCVQRIQRGRIEGGGGVQTACQQSCPARAISFGDQLSDPQVKEQQHSPRAFQVLAELGVRPSITYLARVRRRLPDPERGT